MAPRRTGIRKHKKTTAPFKSPPTRASRPRSALTADSTPLINHIQPQVELSARSSVVKATQLELVQPFLKAPEIQPRGWKRKRGQEEAEPNKRRQGPSPPADKPAAAFTRLNKKDLTELNKLNRRKEPKAIDAMLEKKRSGKRSRSRTSTTEISDDNTTTVSTSTHKSSISLSNYRLITLDRQRIVFEHGHIYEHVQTRLDSIFQSPVSEDDEREVTSIAKSLCDDFADVLKAACREDDSVELIYRALESINKNLLGQAFAIRRKADWDPSLKPTVQRRRYSSVLPAKTPNGTNSALDKSCNERQPYVTPEGSAPIMPPPPVPPNQDGGIKTPCPDITIGLHHHVVAAKLESVGVIMPYADELLKDLQYDKALRSCPAQSALLLRFPSLVVEGKSYATGKCLYEAQNQAAVSGSMMLVIQHQLCELAGSTSINSPLAFSICSEGPVMELWVHYNTSDGSVRYYKIHFLQICHASALHLVVEFFLAVLRIMRWARSTFLEDIAGKLLGLWKTSQEITT
ncbi:MAG: hypothetical protein Q9166_006541 [cf. Caloplaca sp. 2 TL-2023]